MSIYFSVIIGCFTFVSSVVIDLHFESKIQHGHQHYSELLNRVQTYGDCWKTVMIEVQEGCKQLTEEVQSRLALSFSNCFLKHSGSKGCNCSHGVPIATCLKNSSDRVFSTYTEFFTHTLSICHFLQQRKWQEDAAYMVLMLLESSTEVGSKLNESVKSQTKIIQLQHAAMNEQKKLIISSRNLNAELLRSRVNARNVYTDFKSTADEQKLLLFEVFDRVRNLQNFVLGEFSGVYTIAYYVIAVVLIYILTIIPRTSNARIWLILLLTLNAVSEKNFAFYSADQILSMDVAKTSELVHARIWILRKIICIISIIILFVCYYTYKDYNFINYQLLQEIHQQNRELQIFIKDINELGPLVLDDSSKLVTQVQLHINDKENNSCLINSATKMKNKKVTDQNRLSSTKSPIRVQESPKQLGSISFQVSSPGSERYNLRRNRSINPPVVPSTVY